jgi:hypothetical protein
LRVVSLRNLAADDPRAYLREERVPEPLHERALVLTHGHPLALALLADVLAQRAETALTEAPDAVRALVQRFADDVPTARHREALEVAAHARTPTEDLLKAVLGGDDAGELCAWLRERSFVERSADGLFPHDLVRDVLDVDLRWRAPETYLARHRAIRSHDRRPAIDPRDAKLQRALARTYVRPAQTQELAADALGLPFSTYRRHLTPGVERVVDWLWQRELSRPEE